ncbi:hypothetical protein B484DRAFT_445907 [Ochromonadaceae sp. CCMP2298]|nr:hypothetical protein B484DRAFT_445907 [Ochromonadaceae sp. CCMP2298]
MEGQSPDPRSASLHCEVMDYSISGNSNFYNNHLFTLRVWARQQTYTVTRSYAAFCELDARLRRQYARSNLPELNLAGAQSHAFNRATSRDKPPVAAIAPLSFLLGPAPLEKGIGDQQLVKRVDTNELIQQKRGFLTSYLRDLLLIPEVLLSDALLFFLDTESADGELLPEEADATAADSEIDLILSAVQPVTKLVRVDRTLDVTLVPNSVVVWSFSTLAHDIGFSIMHEKREMVTYQRYRSHDTLIRGSFEAPSAERVSFIWDNSYSRWRTKTVSYKVQVVSKAEYERVVSSTVSLKKERAAHAKQRALLKSTLTALSIAILQTRSASFALMAGSSPKGQGKAAAPEKGAQTVAEGDGRETGGRNPSVEMGTLGTGVGVQMPGEDEREREAAWQLMQEGQEEMELGEARREISHLRGVKLTLQAALGYSESALVAERALAARHVQEAEAQQEREQSLQQELAEMGRDLDLLKQSYYAELEEGLAGTLPRPQKLSICASVDGGDADAGEEQTEGAEEGAAVPSPSIGTSVISGTSSSAAGSVCGDSAADETPAAPATAPAPSPSPAADLPTKPVQVDAQDNKVASPPQTTTPALAPGVVHSPLDSTEEELLQIPVEVVAAYDSANLVAHLTALNNHLRAATLLRKTLSETEQQRSKLRAEKKQLKAYAIELKASLEKMKARYIEAEHEKTMAIGQVREAQDVISFLELDRTGLKSAIALLSGDAPDQHMGRVESKYSTFTGVSAGGNPESNTGGRWGTGELVVPFEEEEEGVEDVFLGNAPASRRGSGAGSRSGSLGSAPLGKHVVARSPTVSLLISADEEGTGEASGAFGDSDSASCGAGDPASVTEISPSDAGVDVGGDSGSVGSSVVGLSGRLGMGTMQTGQALIGILPTWNQINSLRRGSYASATAPASNVDAST